MAQLRTYSDLKTVIADDLARSDLTASIALAVEDAVQYYQSERFWFNESRTVTFDTVNGQEVYTASDDVEIPTFISIDNVWLSNAGELKELAHQSIADWEQLSDNSASTGEPYYYTYFNNALYLYPTPTQAYTIRLHGQQGSIIDATAVGSAGIGAPDNDSEVNPYIQNAFELLRSHAKMLIYAHKLMEPGLAAAMEEMARKALMALHREGQKRQVNNIIRPTCF